MSVQKKETFRQKQINLVPSEKTCNSGKKYATKKGKSFDQKRTKGILSFMKKRNVKFYRSNLMEDLGLVKWNEGDKIIWNKSLSILLPFSGLLIS